MRRSIVVMELDAPQSRFWPSLEEVFEHFWQADAGVPQSSNCFLLPCSNSCHVTVLREGSGHHPLATLRGRFTRTSRSSSGKTQTADSRMVPGCVPSHPSYDVVNLLRVPRFEFLFAPLNADPFLILREIVGHSSRSNHTKVATQNNGNTWQTDL